ncbi:hypothetical protein BP5796_12873 [Coleophoma crateriformis]|uniref:Reverse transcriptase/retrotransposon-derived protein RNase H-like domain-containing protein n=1 Tax=Coleophoma crateriformis TaxID=565419 RepID=A0A3D8Q4P7_9HELO|nr:hypothetical protein BP5796_12873 [Coleophoma crateriformis]
MGQLKAALTIAPALIKMDYSEGAGERICGTDSLGAGWGGFICQVKEGKRHPVRFESGIWNKAERVYDATKLECRAVLKALKKFRFYLDIPGALVTRWLAWIRLFDFEVRHIKGHANKAADGLSRRPPTEQDLREEEQEEDLDKFIDMELDDYIDYEMKALQIMKITVSNPVRIRPLSESQNDRNGDPKPDETGDILHLEDDGILDGRYSRESRDIAWFLTYLTKPRPMAQDEYRSFRRKATNYLVNRKTLFKRGTAGTPQTRVVDLEIERQKIIERLHDYYGHKGRESTY